MKNIIIGILLAGLLALAVTAYHFYGVKQVPIVKYDTVYKKYDSLIYIPRDSIVYRDTGTHTTTIIRDSFEVPVKADERLIDYDRIRLYKDTAFKASIGYVVITDTVQHNRITSRHKLEYFNIVTEHKYVQKPLLLAGIGAGYAVNKFGINVKLLYIPNRKVAYGISHDIINNYTEISCFIPIRFNFKKHLLKFNYNIGK